MKVGYARCSTVRQDLEAQTAQLVAAGVESDRIYVDHGISGATRQRPGLNEALAALREGDTLVVTKLDRLGRSLRDLIDIGETIANRRATLEFGGVSYRPDDPMGRMFFQLLAVFAEFERELKSQRTREGMAIAKRKGNLRGRSSKLTPARDAEIRRMHESGDYTITKIAELFSVDRATVHRSLKRSAGRAGADEGRGASRAHP